MVGVVVLTVAALLFHKASPPAIQTTPAAAAEFEAKLKEADVATQGYPRTLSADQKELNSYIDSRLQLAREADSDGTNSLRDLKLQLKEDRARIYVLLNAYGKDMTLELEGKLRTEDGYLRFDPIGGKVGALPIPRSALQSSMRQMMNSPEGRQQLRLPENLSDVHVEDGKIVATFK